jgi:hypothetical protein
MAINIISSPSNASPSANTMLIRATSTATGNANFRMVCDVRDSANSVTYARLKSDLIPSTSECFFDIGPILRSLVDSQGPQVIQNTGTGTLGTRAGWLNMSNAALEYRINLYEEYGTPPVVITGSLQSITGKIVFQGAFSQDQYWSWIDSVRYPGTKDLTNGHKALTDLGGDTDLQMFRTVPSISYGAISIGTRPTGNWERARITYYVGATNIRQYFVWMPTASVNAFINSFACYPMNIRALPAGSGSTVKNACSDGNSGDFNFVGAGGSYYVDRYTVEFLDDLGQVGGSYTFIIDPCAKWSQPTNANPASGTPKSQAGPIHLHWWNDYGGTDTMVFMMKNRRRQEVGSKATYGANQDTYGTWVNTRIYGGDWEDVYTLNTDWLTDAEFLYLGGLMRSSRIFIDDAITPTKEAMVVQTSFTYFTRMDDRLKQVQIEVRVSPKIPIV